MTNLLAGLLWAIVLALALNLVGHLILTTVGLLNAGVVLTLLILAKAMCHDESSG